MQHRHTRVELVAILLAACVAVVAVGAVGTGTVAAQEDLPVDVGTPETASVGEAVQITASVATPDLPRDRDGDMTVTLSVDGERVDRKTVVAVSNGSTDAVGFDHSFSAAGSHDVSVTATVAFGGTEYVGSSRVATVDVELEPSVDLSASVPPSTVTGRETGVAATVSATGIPDDVAGTLTVTLSADGDTLAETTYTTEGEDETEVNFEHVFTQSGNTTLTLTVTGTIGDRSVSESVSRSVHVGPMDRIERTGVAFPVPASLEDEVEAYREANGLRNGLHAFVLANDDELFVVFTAREPVKGTAVVTGQQLAGTISYEDLEFGVIGATDVTFDRTGTETTVEAVAETPEAYHLELVRIDATYRRVSTLTDPDAGTNLTVAETVGVLVEDPTTATDRFETPGQRAGNFVVNASTRDRGATPSAAVTRLLAPPDEPHLVTFSFEKHFWADANATVDAVVLAPDSAARTYVATIDDPNVTAPADRKPLLYTVQEDFHPKAVENVSTVKRQGESLSGEVVELDARLFQERISVQEFVEHNTGCDTELLQIQTPQGPVCVNVVQDVLLHSGVAWNTVPTAGDDVLFVAGLSARHQDNQTAVETGYYRITGEVVHTSRVDDSLPDGSVLVVYDLTRYRDIDWRAVGAEARAIIEGRASELRESVTDGLNSTIADGGVNESLPNGSERSVADVIAGEDGTVSTADLQRAISLWARNAAVPGTGGERIDTATLQAIIRRWATGGSGSG